MKSKKKLPLFTIEASCTKLKNGELDMDELMEHILQKNDQMKLVLSESGVSFIRNSDFNINELYPGDVVAEFEFSRVFSVEESNTLEEI